MRSRIRCVFVLMYEFYAKKTPPCFLKVSLKKGCLLVIIKYNLFSYVYIIPVSLSRPGIYMCMVSIFP